MDRLSPEVSATSGLIEAVRKMTARRCLKSEKEENATRGTPVADGGVEQALAERRPRLGGPAWTKKGEVEESKHGERDIRRTLPATFQEGRGCLSAMKLWCALSTPKINFRLFIDENGLQVVVWARDCALLQRLL
ncbi:hypothetical protein NDU88_000873 [Pleurodeles waltl]|uniref:Uncharacterized protein n=1 Tax=Pleurodeles waltl TaxID=8319 RepID=A0AAV7KQJ9_PLEWA|nr:hypothetical protein NDU88_000873 [Pleurodeles waltl]